MSQSCREETLITLQFGRAGEKYRPSNGTEGQLFLGAFCRRCQREGHTADGGDDGQRCEIMGMTMIYQANEPEYPAAWQYGNDGQPCCTAFIPAGEPITAPRCTHTLELF